MEDFKAGDWVTSIKFKSVPPMRFDGFHKSDFKQWQPKVGEWCWFWNPRNIVPELAKFEYMHMHHFYTNRDIIYDWCEPFIGELPSLAKENE